MTLVTKEEAEYYQAKYLLESNNIKDDKTFKTEKYGYLGGKVLNVHWERFKKEEGL